MTKTQPASLSAFVWPLIGLIVVVGILYAGKPVIVPLALAVLLTFILAPVVAMIQRRGLPRVPSVLLTALLTFILFGAVGYVVGLQIHSFARELPTHRKEIDEKIADLRGDGEGAFGKLLQMIREIGKGEAEGAAPAQVAPKEKVVIAQPQEVSSFEQLGSAIAPVLEPLAQAGLVIILVIFMLIKREDLRNRMVGLIGHGRLAGTTRVLVDSAQRISRFLLTQTLVNIGFGVLFAIGLFFAGVPYAFLWGFLTVILRFVPYIGSLVAVTFPLILAFAVAPGWAQPISVVVVFVVLELVTGNVLEPLLVGHGTGVTPIALLIAAAFWAWVWGPMGLVLSTPLTVCLVVLGQHVPRLHFLAILLGDEPALEPHFSYYQRLLARDEEEAKQVAADYAKANGQEKLFDEVFLPALALTRLDRKAGGLAAEDEEFIFKATKELLESLGAESANAATQTLTTNATGEEAHALKTPATGKSAAMVFGCPAHDESEELALDMLARTLRADGYRAEMVSTRALSGEVEATVEREKPSLVFIAILPPGGLVQACHLCERLRKKFAGLPIIVGYWGNERHYNKVLVRLRAAGASYVTTSIGQSLSQTRALVSAPVDAGAVPSVERSLPDAGSPRTPKALKGDRTHDQH